MEIPIMVDSPEETHLAITHLGIFLMRVINSWWKQHLPFPGELRNHDWGRGARVSWGCFARKERDCVLMWPGHLVAMSIADVSPSLLVFLAEDMNMLSAGGPYGFVLLPGSAGKLVSWSSLRHWIIHVVYSRWSIRPPFLLDSVLIIEEQLCYV